MLPSSEFVVCENGCIFHMSTERKAARRELPNSEINFIILLKNKDCFTKTFLGQIYIFKENIFNFASFWKH